jgi:hypothetical protein
VPPPVPESKPLGWREWVSIPDWGVEAVKAKVDTGARTSALHAFDLESFVRDDDPWLRFVINPWQRSDDDRIVVEAPRLDRRTVRSSSGARSNRPVVMTTLRLAGVSIEAELTLTRRDEMGFRMLIGREVLRRGFVVDSARSYIGGKPRQDVRRRNRGQE